METESRVITEEKQLQEFIGEFVKDFGPGPAKDISNELRLQQQLEEVTNQNKLLRAQNMVLKFEKATAEQRVQDLTFKLRVRKREIQRMNQRLMIHSLERKYLDNDVEATLVAMLDAVRDKKNKEKAE